MGALPSQKYDTILMEFCRWLLKDNQRIIRMKSNSYRNGEVTLGYEVIVKEFLRMKDKR